VKSKKKKEKYISSPKGRRRKIEKKGVRKNKR